MDQGVPYERPARVAASRKELRAEIEQVSWRCTSSDCTALRERRTTACSSSAGLTRAGTQARRQDNRASKLAKNRTRRRSRSSCTRQDGRCALRVLYNLDTRWSSRSPTHHISSLRGHRRRIRPINHASYDIVSLCATRRADNAALPVLDPHNLRCFCLAVKTNDFFFELPFFRCYCRMHRLTSA